MQSMAAPVARCISGSCRQQAAPGRSHCQAHLDAKKRAEQTQPACGGNHDLVPQAYQCQECGWWIVRGLLRGDFKEEGMFQARVTSADQVFLEAYKALCVEHGRQIDIWGPEWEVEISAYAGDTLPILFLPFLKSPSCFMHFVDPETGTVEKVVIKPMPPFVVPKE